MNIYIDESGQFRPLDMTRSRAAAVASVAIPSANRMRFASEFRKLKRFLRGSGAELKGSRLPEADVAQCLRLLRRHDAIAEAVVIDVGQHAQDDIARFKAAQADKLLEHITRDHHASLIHQLVDFQRRLGQLSNQLFLQAFGMWQLIPRILEIATMFYSQRTPRELGRFAWRVDAKDRSITELEELWTQLILPIITTKSEIAPMGMIPGGDYSYYERFDAAPPPGAESDDRRLFTDIKKVLREDFPFVASHADLGVQAADIVVSALTRALNGALDISGWLELGPLFVRRRNRTVQLIAVNPDSPPYSTPLANDHWVHVIKAIEKRARPMLTRQTAIHLREAGA